MSEQLRLGDDVKALIEKERRANWPLGHHGPWRRCTPDDPCVELNDQHVVLWGECFHRVEPPT